MAQMTSKITITRDALNLHNYLKQLDGQRSRSSLTFGADISVSKPLRKEIKPGKHSAFEGTICDKDSQDATSISR